MAASAVMPTDRAASTTARNSVTVAGWTLISRITGVLRVVVIGPVLGATYFANAFQTSYMLPHLVFTLIAGPVLGMVLVPSVVRAVSAGGTPVPGRSSSGSVDGCLRPRCWSAHC